MQQEFSGSSGPANTFQTYLKAGEIRLQKCVCGRFVFFPRVICPHCGSEDLEWVPISGHGTVYSCTVVHQKPERGGDYNISLIDLDEGVRLLSRVEDIPPLDVVIGARVRARISPAKESLAITFTMEGKT